MVESENSSAKSSTTPLNRGWWNSFVQKAGVDRLINAIALIGVVLDIWGFAVTLYQISTGSINFGLYLQSILIVFFFLIFVALSRYKLERGTSFLILFSTCFAIVLIMLLVATYFVATEVVLRVGFDIRKGMDMSTFSGFVAALGASRSAIVLFMFISAYFGASYFLAQSHPFVSKVAAVPIFCLFVYLLYVLVSGRELQEEFESGVNLRALPGYIAVTLMSVALLIFASSALRRADRQRP